MTDNDLVLLWSSPDGPGIVGDLGTAVADAGGNITEAQQHTEGTQFVARLEISAGADQRTLEAALAAVSGNRGGRWSLHEHQTADVVVMCGRQLHCVADLVARASIGELPCRIAAIVSNHSDARQLAERHDITFEHVPDTGDRAAQEQQVADVLEDTQADLVVLARYMRILPEHLCSRWSGKMINIHHSFLPSFVGAKAYARAHERGVKMIGATAHYVTGDLDEGPIIAQNTVNVTHSDTVADLTRRGADIERQVLAEAVVAHLEYRIVVCARRVVVFR